VLLGISRAAEFAELKVTLGPGDLVVFYTDGVTEMKNERGELFGVERLGEAVATRRADDPETLIAEVLAALERFAGTVQRDDDLTIVAMKLAA
jgi:sigma-B regulation protein RsbU (phosphoserine phosphatase)